MPEAQGQEKVNKVPHAGDHDRVTMLSLKADGTTDQHNPEIIGDKDFALAAAKRQFAEQAVSAVDVSERGVTTAGADESTEPDPATAALKEKQDAAASAGEKAAVSAVNSLHKGLS